MDDDEWFTIAEWTQRLGSLVWVEQHLAEVLSAWSAVDADPAAAVALSTAGAHHAWHGEVLVSCLPTSPQLRVPDPIVAPTEGWERAIATLRSLDDPAGTAVRLRSLTKVVNPWLERETGSLLELARPISDAAIMRWMRFVDIDHATDHRSLADLALSYQDAPARFADHRLLSELDLS